jgi:hypothetical protein
LILKSKNQINKIAVSDPKDLQRFQTLLVKTDISNNGTVYKNCLTLLDTGASISVASLAFSENLERAGFKLKKQTPQRRNPIAAKGTEMPISFDLVINVILRGNPDITFKNTKISIIKGLQAELILGVDSLMGRTLQVRRRTVCVDGQLFPLALPRNTVILQVMEMGETDGLNFLRVKISPRKVEKASERLLLTLDPELSPGVPEVSMIMKSSELEADSNIITIPGPPVLVPRIFLARIDEVPQESKTQRKGGLTPDDITKMTSNTKLSAHGIDRLVCILEKHSSAFSKEKTEVGLYSGPKVKLQLLDPRLPGAWVRPRRIPISQIEWLKGELEKMEQAGIIEKATGSAFNAPLQLVKKSSGGYRICVDMRSLNNRLAESKWPLPSLAETLESLEGTTFFSCVDIRQAFFHMALEDESKPLTAFSALNRQWQFRRLPMGLKISPSVYQMAMKETLGNDLGKNCVVYLDDVLVTGKTESEHLKALDVVLDRLQKAGFLLNPEKCILGAKQITFLGHEVTTEGYYPKSDNLKAIREFPKPTNKKALRRFIGMTAFYSTLVPKLQFKLAPLHAISGSKTEYDWTSKQDEAFDDVKASLLAKTGLAFPSTDPDAQLIVTSDASDTGYGGMLSQKIGDNPEQPLGYTSGFFRGPAVRWAINEKELFAFLKTLEVFHHHTYGRSFLWRTDSKCLAYICAETNGKQTKRPSAKKLRWLEKLGEYDFSISHMSGTSPEMAVPDCLSRIDPPGETVMNIDPAIENKFKQLGRAIPTWIKLRGITKSELRECQDKDPDLLNFSNDWKPFKSKFKVKLERDGVYIYDGKVPRIPIPLELQERIILSFHLPQHGRTTNMLESMRNSGVIFPRMAKKVKSRILSCPTCLATGSTEKTKFKPIPAPKESHPYMTVTIDLLGPLPSTPTRKKYILAAIDNLTRWIELRCIPDKTAAHVAKALMDIFFIRGPPRAVSCDNGREFNNSLLRELLASFGTCINYGVPYRPQGQGLIERANREIVKYLKGLDIDEHRWDTHIPAIQLSMNLTYHSALGSSPFQALHGWTAAEPLFSKEVDGNEIQTDVRLWVQESGARMCAALALLTAKQAVPLTPIPDESDDNALEPGTHVLLKTMTPPGVSSKMYSPWKGGYVVRKRCDLYSYLITPLEAPRRRFLVHRQRIRMVHNDLEKSQSESSPREVNANSSFMKLKIISRSGGH